ncbi:asparagine synthase [Microbacterium sp. SORGH_AS_0888]|uniref:asparagine synthase n=1 Tax=Microbacterium sp. SORGH_AS_0888 TaxID=3041791 RepID=UPI002783B49E|nr:asparagine synthase [Microbacterium sp. SORGH_AS_0888]MDQ1130520.1 hypothetical protein [Microbacterium sp. SORGH_AS_0888]
MASKDDRDASVRGAIGMPAKRPKLGEIVAEGVYIAAAATRLALKNRILVEILAAGEGFDVERFLPDAKATLLALADEAEEDAARTERERRRARRRFSDSDGTHDYRSRDVRNLRRRRKQSERIARELRERAENPEELRALVEAAREAAWAEVSRNIDSSLRISAARPDLEPDYEKMRRARMQSLVLVDLARLAAHRRRMSEAAASDDTTAE